MTKGPPPQRRGSGLGSFGQGVAATAPVSHWERGARKSEHWVPLAVLNLVRERLMPEPTCVEMRRTA